MPTEEIENSNDNQHPPRNWVTAFSFLALLVSFLILNAKMVAPFILSIMMGGILTILSFPYYKKLRSKNLGPFLASSIVTTSIGLIVVIPLIIFTLVAIKQATNLSKSFAQTENISIDSITQKLSETKLIFHFFEDQDQLKVKLTEMIQNGTTATAQTALGLVGSIPERLLQLAVAMLSCFFLLIDGRRFLVFLNDKIPLDGDVRTKLYGSFKGTAISVIWATIAAASAQSAVMFFSFLILGIPSAFLAGGATFIFAWIPFIGCLPVWIAGAVYLYSKGRTIALVFMIVLGLLTGVIDNYVRPQILKGRDELHPLVSLISIFGGIAMFGIVGVFFGPVFAATLVSLLQIWPTVGKRFGLTFDPPMQIHYNKRKTDIS